MDINVVIAFLVGLAPWAGYALGILGSLVTIGTLIDALIPEKVDGNFMTKIFAIPFLGAFLQALTRFSPFNVRGK